MAALTWGYTNSKGFDPEDFGPRPTEAVRTKEPVLKFGPSLSAFMADLGLLPRGGRHGPIGRLREQMQRLFSATIAFTWDRSEQGEWHDAGFRVAKETHLWWTDRRALGSEDGFG